MRSTLVLAIFLLTGCGQRQSPQYLQDMDAQYDEGHALQDPQDRLDHTVAQGQYMTEKGARPFEDVLADVKRGREEHTRENLERLEILRDIEEQIQENTIRTLADIERRRDERGWKQEVILRELKVGDSWPYLVGDRMIERDDGNTVYIFQRKSTIGVNTTVTVNSTGIIIDITRYQ